MQVCSQSLKFNVVGANVAMVLLEYVRAISVRGLKVSDWLQLGPEDWCSRLDLISVCKVFVTLFSSSTMN